MASVTREELLQLAKSISITVGRMKTVTRHPNAEKLYIETVSFGPGEEEKTVISGLVPYFTEEDMRNRLCLFVTNMKPAK